MKLIRHGEPGAERAGLIDPEGRRRDCSSIVPDIDARSLRNGGVAELRKANINRMPILSDEVRWGACVARPGKVVCIGLNYADHAAESGAAVPTEPIVFLKASNTVVGPYDDVLIPKLSKKTDWEVELGVVIGKDARYLASVDEATQYIAGYCISNDVSEREFQLERGGQWTKGKSCDTFNPLGPWLVTPDEVPDPKNLSMKLSVNGRQFQNGNSKTMIFDVPFLIHYLSQFMTLEAGDVLTTGTPPGVGLGQKPPLYLKDGDVMELSIDGLGQQRQQCRQA